MRQKSLQLAVEYGYPINESLPLLDIPDHIKSTDEIIRRLLSLHVVAACAYGFDRNNAREWIKQENIYECLTDSEKNFIEKGGGDANQFKVQVEGMWALAWGLNLIPNLDFTKHCDNKFVMLLPNLKILENSYALRSRAKFRSSEEILKNCDLAYCLHWGIRQSELYHGKCPGNVQPYVVIERRRALEWLINPDDWVDILLDT